MKLWFLIRVMIERRRLLRHDRWSPDQLQRHVQKEWSNMINFARNHSPFYATRLARHGQEMTVTKREVMESFDTVVTVTDVCLTDLQDHIQSPSAQHRFKDKYEVAATSGTSGLRGLFPVIVSEWVTIIASYSRSYAWAGLRPNLLRRKRMAVISTTKPWHQSARVGDAVRSRFVPTLRLDATDTTDLLVARLNEFQPQSLVGYPSIIRVLAARQREGTLRIAPEVVMCSSERLTAETRKFIEEAFATRVFNVYGATETATIASECEHHRLHIFEDLVHVEVLDDDGNPVPDGQVGRVIVTPLFYKTLPLLRYDMGDKIAIDATSCKCGRSYRSILNFVGREDETIAMTSKAGREVSFHSNMINDLIEPYPVEGWQVVPNKDRISIYIQSKNEALVLSLESAIRQTLTHDPWDLSGEAIAVERVTSLRHGASGKTQRLTQ
jgi:phenylacetate-CoA ligase